MVDFGKLSRVPLREAWSNEAQSFTPWVAENLEMLSEAIGITLALEQTEKSIGDFSADVLCTDTLTSRPVLIENQIERTDHTHLGQTITYAAGIGASAVVWIAASFRDEHRAALDWLNEHTDDDLAFFGLEVELWRIGTSAVAPKFNIVSKPNDWARTVHAAAQSPGIVTDLQQAQVEFWTQFTELRKQSQSPLRSSSPSPNNWISHPLGRSGYWLSSVWSTYNSLTNTAGGEIREELVIQSPNSKDNYAALLSRREEIESSLRSAGVDAQIHWYNPDTAKVCRVFVRKDVDTTKKEDWMRQQEWLLQQAEAFLHVFAPIVKTL